MMGSFARSNRPMQQAASDPLPKSLPFSTPHPQGPVSELPRAFESASPIQAYSHSFGAVAVQELAEVRGAADLPIQFAGGAHAYDAGSGGDWHIHHGDHIKYNGSDNSRVDFNGRSKRQIRAELGAKIDRYGLENTTRSQDFRDCINYINEHF